MSIYSRTYQFPTGFKKFFTLFIKILVLCASVYFIYHRLMCNDDLPFKEFKTALCDSPKLNFRTIILLLFFSAINLLLESLKWYSLVSHITLISFKEAFMQTFASLTVSLFTPNRVGEYGAKVMYYPPSLRKPILGLNLLGNLSQLLATLLFGLLGTAFYFTIFYPSYCIYLYMGFLTLALVGFLCYKYVNLFQFSFFQKLKAVFFDSFQYKPVYKKIIALSLLRYLFFAHQFYVLTILFDFQSSYLVTMSIITTMYLISSFVPTLFLADVLVKGSVAVWLFVPINESTVLILVITTLMWLLNFALPALLGGVFVLNFKSTSQ